MRLLFTAILGLILFLCRARSESSGAEKPKLDQLACEHFRDELPSDVTSFNRFFREVSDQNTKLCEYGSATPTDNNPEKASQWPNTRTIQASWIN